MQKTLKILTVLTLFAAASAFAGLDLSEDVREKHFYTKRGTGLSGYDPVSYFAGEPREGNKGITAT